MWYEFSASKRWALFSSLWVDQLTWRNFSAQQWLVSAFQEAKLQNSANSLLKLTVTYPFTITATVSPSYYTKTLGTISVFLPKAPVKPMWSLPFHRTGNWALVTRKLYMALCTAEPKADRNLWLQAHATKATLCHFTGRHCILEGQLPSWLFS